MVKRMALMISTNWKRNWFEQSGRPIKTMKLGRGESNYNIADLTMAEALQLFENPAKSLGPKAKQASFDLYSINA